MQISPEATKKAKKIYRKYVFARIATLFAMGILVGFAAVSHSIPIMIFVPIFAILVAVIIISILARVLIFKTGTHKLDPEAYLATVYHYKFDNSSSTWQIFGEYIFGNYKNVISICKRKLCDKVAEKRYKCSYLAYLANVYFDVGDDERLEEVCASFEVCISSKKPRAQAKSRIKYPYMAFFRMYLNRQFDDCAKWLGTAPTYPLDKYRRLYLKARLALIQENSEEANGYFEQLASEVPQLNFGKLAAKHLCEANNQDTAAYEQLQTSDDSSAVLIVSDGKKRGLSLAVFICSAILLTFMIFDSVSKEIEYSSFVEEVRVLVEQDYDGVTVCDVANLTKGVDHIDTIFVCTTDEYILVGCLYTYLGESELRYEVFKELPIASLSDENSPLLRCQYHAKTSDNTVDSCFYINKSKLPSEYYYLSKFEVKGQTVYYVVSDIISDSISLMLEN